MIDEINEINEIDEIDEIDDLCGIERVIIDLSRCLDKELGSQGMAAAFDSATALIMCRLATIGVHEGLNRKSLHALAVARLVLGAGPGGDVSANAKDLAVVAANVQAHVGECYADSEH